MKSAFVSLEHYWIKEHEMEFLIYVVSGVMLLSSLAGTWFLSRMIIKLDDQNKPIFQKVINSIEKTNEISHKLDHVLLDGQKSRQHQQKLFEHNRVLLASLNSQVTKLDVMLRVASQDSKVPDGSPSGGSGSAITKSSQNKQPGSPTSVSSILKLNSKSLPKTEHGVTLLEQLFNQRQLSGKSEIIERTKVNENLHSEQLAASSTNVKPTTGIPRKSEFEVHQKDESMQKLQAPHQRSNPRMILNLFASRDEHSPSETEHERRRA